MRALLSARSLPLVAVAVAVAVALAVALGPAELAHAGGPILHEPIPPDPHEDLMLSASVDGDLPAALQTPSGLVTAPDPRKPVGAREQPYSPDGALGGMDATKFVPDRDTRRPDVMPYHDPFTPSTAPFKRLIAFDGVDAAYNLIVKNDRLHALATHAEPASDGSEEQFFANLIVDVAPQRRVRIPSVGPGTRIVHARLGAGSDRVGFRILRDGAENWFLETERQTRARLVLELTVPRASFGGDFSDPRWSDLPPAPALPSNVQIAANTVASRIGVSRAQRPRENVTKLVGYFRAFVDSAEPPTAQGDIYVDLALSKKGVCRHRAFAFMVTALGLGVPTRVVINEAHAWVEVHDGARWRRIDLGGAGRTLRDPLGGGVPHEVPADPFSWPPGASRGEELAQRARSAARSGGNGASAGGGRSTAASAEPSAPSGSTSAASTAGGASARSEERDHDERPRSTVSMAVTSQDPRRGAPLHVRGDVRADGDPCGHIAVEIVLRDPKSRGQEVVLGSLATGAKGAYAGALVVPRGVPLGEYEVLARTQGNARCGRGVGP